CFTGSHAATVVTVEDNCWLDELHLEGGRGRLYCACRSYARGKVGLQANTRCIHRCSHFWRAGQACCMCQRGLGKEVARRETAGSLRYGRTEPSKNESRDSGLPARILRHDGR